jgi:hypothetical protein
VTSPPTTRWVIHPGRLQIGTVAAFKSEWVAAFKSEYPAGFTGIRRSLSEIELGLYLLRYFKCMRTFEAPTIYPDPLGDTITIVRGSSVLPDCNT